MTLVEPMDTINIVGYAINIEDMIKAIHILKLVFTNSDYSHINKLSFQHPSSKNKFENHIIKAEVTRTIPNNDILILDERFLHSCIFNP